MTLILLTSLPPSVVAADKYFEHGFEESNGTKKVSRQSSIWSDLIYELLTNTLSSAIVVQSTSPLVIKAPSNDTMVSDIIDEGYTYLMLWPFFLR